MTLLIQDALQDPNTILKPHWIGQGSSTVMGATTGRDGSANGAANFNAAGLIALPGSGAATCIVAGGWAASASDFGTNGLRLIQFQSAVSTIQLTITLNTSGFIEARKGTASGTLLGTSSGHAAINNNQWFHMGVKAVLHTTAGSVTIQYNGTTVLTLAGVSTSTVSGNVTHLNFGRGGNGIMWLDDLVVMDGVDATATQGRPFNDFLGDLKVAILVPTAAGDSTQWTPSTGSNWAAVDEIPPNTTDYVSDSTSGHVDLYNLADLPSGAGTVYAVQAHLYASASDSGGISVKPALKENSVETDDTAQSLASTSWVTLSGSLYTKRPSDGSLWTVTDVNALQAGVKVA